MHPLPSRLSPAGFRPVDIASWEVDVTAERGGVWRITPRDPLAPYPVSLTASLDYWATHAPGRIFLAQRHQDSWKTLTYARFRALSHSVAQALLDRGLTSRTPIAILSGNDLEHAILGMAALYAGIPYAPISPAYSQIATAFDKLRHIVELLDPALVFAADGLDFERAIDAVVPRETPLVVTANPPGDRHAILFEDLCARTPTADLDRATAAITGDTVAKILFTSGSTGVPKGVINTHKMLCSNQQMLRAVYPFLATDPPVICDWLPWNHTFGGNHNVGLVLFNGGSLYIDGGKPTGPAFQETIRNLAEIAPTVYFNVPKGYELLVEHLNADAALSSHFFSRLKMAFYAGASLSKHTWDAFDQLAVATCGQRIVMMTGLGATETAPFALSVNKETANAGVVGLPVPGVELKLVPAGGKLEARVRGPNITPGFWHQPEATAAAFDDEGFYCLGDALRFLDPENPALGLVFDGRIAEDFKLSTGTWVSVGPLRASFILHAAPFVRDIVIAGHDRDEITALVFLDPIHADRFAQDGGARPTLERLLETFAAQSTGSSNRIERAMILDDPPSLDQGEVTDKGSINQKAVLRCRAALVEQLYSEPFHPSVIFARSRA